MDYLYYGYDLDYYMILIPIILLSMIIGGRLKYKNEEILKTESFFWYDRKRDC